MKIVCDHVLVRVDSELNDFLAVIKDENGNDVELKLDPTFNPTHHARIKAEVIAIPTYMSGKEIVYEKYVGLPRPVQYRDSDFIKKQFDALPPKLRLKENIRPYVCSTWTPEYQTTLGVPIEVGIGDTIYFHYGSLINLDNYKWRDGRFLVYQIPYSQIFCVIRDGIKMLNSFVLVSEVYDDDVEDIELNDERFSWKFKGKTKNGIVTQIAEKPKYLIGKLEHIGKGIGEDTRDIEPGSTILFRPMSEFKNTIEGREYYVMRQWDIVAEVLSRDELRSLDTKMKTLNLDQIDFSPMRPVGDYVMIEPEEVELKSTYKVWDQTKNEQQFKPGEIFVLPSAVSHKKTNKKAGVGQVLLSGENTGMWYGKRVYYGKGLYYLYVEEYGKIFIRERDIFGWFE